MTHVLFLLFSETTAGECKRRNEFVEWHVAWLAESHNYAEFNLWKMAQRKKFNRKACAHLCSAFFGANLSKQSIKFAGPFITAIKARLKLKHS